MSYIMVLDGQVVGTWKRTITKDGVTITPNLFVPLNQVEADAFIAAANHYGAFLEKPVALRPYGETNL